MPSSTPAARPDAGASARVDPRVMTFGRMAPSWSFTPYACPNGWALVAVVLGAVATIVAFPWGPFGMVPAAVSGLGAICSGVHGRRRLRRRPHLGGGRLASVGVLLGIGAIAIAAAGLVGVGAVGS